MNKKDLLENIRLTAEIAGLSVMFATVKTVEIGIKTIIKIENKIKGVK